MSKIIWIGDKRYTLTEEHEDELKNLAYVIVKNDVDTFSGYLVVQDQLRVTLIRARRIINTAAPFGICHLAVNGIDDPEKWAFSDQMKEVRVLNTELIFFCTNKAKASIKSAPSKII